MQPYMYMFIQLVVLMESAKGVTTARPKLANQTNYFSDMNRMYFLSKFYFIKLEV